MATTKHARTLALAATSPRVVPVALPTNISVDFSDNVTGSTKPANNATVNRVTRSASAPPSPVDGDIWVDTSVTPNVIRTRVSGAWQASASYTTNTNQITDGANLGGTAAWTGVTGATKPADNATVNRVTRAGTAPASPVDGDIWIDTSVTPNVVKTRIGGAWISSANYTTNTNQLTDGAGLGTTATWASVSGTGRPTDYADVTTTILAASGTSVVMTNAQLFKSASGTAGVFIGSGGLFGKDSGGNTTFSINGSTGAASFAGSLSAATGSFAGSLSAATGSFGAVTAGGAVTLNTTGSISNGISYGGTGIFLGYSGGAYKFSLGDATKYLRWDGSTLTFTGALSGATGTFSGTMSASNITSGTISGASLSISSAAGGWLIRAIHNDATVEYRMLSGYNLDAGSLASPGSPALKGTSIASAVGIHGTVRSANTNATAHGVRGENEYNDASGLVGAGNGYDFYAEGAGTNYGPFTGAHDALVPLGTTPEIGDIVCDQGVAVRKNVSNTICFVAPSTTVGQGSAVGVVATAPRSLNDGGHIPAALIDFRWNTTQPDGTTHATDVPCREFADLRLTHAVIAINALGEGQLNVCGEGGNLQPGDLITTSSTPGKGMRQADDVVRASSVAKCREAVVFDHPAQVKPVACIYLCG